MKLSIKLNKTSLPKYLHNITRSVNDPRRLLQSDRLNRPEFSKHISSIRINNTYKTTKPARHSSSNKLLLQLALSNKKSVILDVGVSDGSTSLDLIESLDQNFGVYFVTDICFKVHAIEGQKATYFYNVSSTTCFMKITDYFVTYDDHKSLFPIRWLSTFILSKAPKYDKQSIKEVDLCQPDLLRLAENDSRVQVYEWNIFESWPYSSVDIIKVANVLNRDYFSDKEIVAAIKNLEYILKPNGKLLIVENRKKEQWSLFAKGISELKLERHGNGGSDITTLIEMVFSKPV